MRKPHWWSLGALAVVLGLIFGVTAPAQLQKPAPKGTLPQLVAKKTQLDEDDRYYGFPVFLRISDDALHQKLREDVTRLHLARRVDVELSLELGTLERDAGETFARPEAPGLGPRRLDDRATANGLVEIQMRKEAVEDQHGDCMSPCTAATTRGRRAHGCLSCTSTVENAFSTALRRPARWLWSPAVLTA